MGAAGLLQKQKNASEEDKGDVDMTDCEMIKALLPMYIEDECSDE